MSHRHQDIPIRPRYGYVDEESGQAEGSGPNPNAARSGATPASSYTEIPFLAQYPGPVPEHVLQDLTPTAAGNPAVPGLQGKGPNGESYVNLDSGEDDDGAEEDDPEEEDNSNSNSNSRDSHSGDIQRHRLKAESNLPYELEGASDSDGMRHFVAHDLEAKLREGVAASTDYSSEHTTPSTSMGPGVPVGMGMGLGSSGNGLLTRRFLQSRNVPEVDGSVLSDIELEAQYLATSVDNLLENLGNLLHSISSITADNVEVHRNAVNKLTDTLDANIKCQYQLLAKAEEITKSMKPTEQLGQRIREIKRLVDMLDSTM
ncbi:BLOC-1-related complex subunit 6 [Drosophila rhopaloa]|uniref:BLOC-1-related complex subunit 6 C-terminal helix domain-containing protein n=1 Tax=Drosophila rhopaloa TaxID=1041015 RepID=A0ABM5I842_DRORH|nr:BLOC-1-related complex subunit 6 [Drosophila rhopaloa]